MDKARLQSEKERLEENKRKLSRLSFRENKEVTTTEDKNEDSDTPTNRFDYIFKIVIIGDAVRYLESSWPHLSHDITRPVVKPLL